jgi:23S rRNA (pseudouridine1915-N3)-methyltransferase
MGWNMKVKVITVGAPSNRHYQALCDDYVRRIRGYLPVEVESVPAEKNASRSDGEIRVREAARLRERLPRQYGVVALDRTGTPFSSEQFSRWLEKTLGSSRKGIVFLIGGPLGLDPELVADAEQTISLSPLTFAHELAAVVLFEQLYRALNYLHGGPYHK